MVYACSAVYATMKITDYLDQQARTLDESSQRIKDFRVFDFNHIPEEPLMREEAKLVIDAYLRYLKTGIANHLFVFGSAPEILAILGDRARIGLHQANEEELAHIAAMTVRTTNSDVRVAIKTLYYVALEEAGNVEEVFSRARRDILKDVLADLNDRNLLILKAAREAPEPFVKEVYVRYRRISRDEGEEPFSYVYFYSSLSYLQSIGLILLLSTKVDRPGCPRLSPARRIANPQ